MSGATPQPRPRSMARKVLASGLAAAALYAGTLGATAAAESPPEEPTPSPATEPTPTPEPATTAIETPETAPVETPTPVATPEPTPEPSPIETPAPTPEPSPAVTASPATPGSPNAARSPDGTAVRDRGGRDVEVTSEARRRLRRDAEPGSRVVQRRPTAAQRRPTAAPRLDRADGTPAPSNSTYTLATPGPAHIGVPNFFIDRFRIPPFLLPIYQAAGMQYGVRWEILAAINEIETDYGRNLNVSSAGALGWMQFIPATWKAYGVDANRDGIKDPYNPVDAIFAAARYLRAAGADQDIRGAIWAYNHADWYVDSVLMRAQAIGGLPSDLVSSLTGLTQGRFPIQAKATYAGHLDRHGIRIFSGANAPVVAVNDGRIKEVGRSHVVLQDAYGNTYTYRHLGEVADTYPARRDRSRPLKKGARVIGGTILGRLGKRGHRNTPYLSFQIRPAGPRAPRIDPKPILDGWRLLDSAALYRTARKRPFFGDDADTPPIGQLLLLSKEQLVRRVLADRRIEIYGCGRGDIRSEQIDRRVLGTMLYLAANGLEPTISSLKCGHGYYTSSGNVSHHSTGTAMDIAAINGITISPATQGPGSITDLTIRRLLTLQGTMKPTQIISLMTFDGADNTLAMSDHDDHIHVGWSPLDGAGPDAARRIDAALKPSQWIRLISRIADIESPEVSRPRSPLRQSRTGD